MTCAPTPKYSCAWRTQTASSARPVHGRKPASVRARTRGLDPSGADASVRRNTNRLWGGTTGMSFPSASGFHVRPAVVGVGDRDASAVGFPIALQPPGRQAVQAEAVADRVALGGHFRRGGRRALARRRRAVGRGDRDLVQQGAAPTGPKGMATAVCVRLGPVRIGGLSATATAWPARRSCRGSDATGRRPSAPCGSSRRWPGSTPGATFDRRRGG